MSSKEQSPLPEVTSQQVYSKAKKILGLHGHPAITPKLKYGRDSEANVIVSIEAIDIPITETPAVSIQIADNKYLLWLKSDRDSQSEVYEEPITLSVYKQKLPDGLDNSERHNEGHPRNIPEKLGFRWPAKVYSIEPTNNMTILREWFPPERVPDIRDGNEFLLTILKKMQTQLNVKSA